MKIRIINVLHHPPPYEAYKNKPRPQVNWDTTDGNWVGIWGYDWPDLLGNKILNISKEFEYEVWQPDLRADKIYIYKFENGLTHKLFPAVHRKYKIFSWRYRVIVSKSLLKELLINYNNNNIIINFNNLYDYLTIEFLKLIDKNKNPIIITFHGNGVSPKILIKQAHNPIKKFLRSLFLFKFSKLLTKVDLISEMCNDHIEELRKTYNGKILKLTMGVDFNSWRNEDKKQVRKKLKLPVNKKIFLSASNLTPIKQVDKIIEAFSVLDINYDFLVLILGHGEKAYEEYLVDLSKKLLKSSKISFIGYKTGDELKDYYNASDFFISASKHEGASVAIMKAFACEIPVIATEFGGTSDLMRDLNSGYLISSKNVKNSLIHTVKKILDGNPINLVDRCIAEKYYDWNNVAHRFLGVYKEMITK